MFDLRVRSSCSIFVFDPRPVSPGRPADPIGLRQTRESACIIITCARIITCSRKHHSSRSQNGKFVPEKSNIWRDCVDGYYDWVKEHIMEGAPLNEADHCGDPPLLLAAGNGHKAVCELLLDEGADVEQRNVMGESPLIRAAHNGHFHTVKFLVEQAKADVNAIDMGDNSALHWAAMRGHVEIVKFLTDQVRFLSRRRWLAAGGAYLQDPGSWGSRSHSTSPLWPPAATLSHVSARNLRTQGADKTLRNKQDKMAIDLCQPCWSDSYRFAREVLA